MKPTVKLVTRSNRQAWNCKVDFRSRNGIPYSVTHVVNVTSDLSSSFVFDGPVWVTTDYKEMTRRVVEDFCHTKVSKKTFAGIQEAFEQVIPKRVQVA